MLFIFDWDGTLGGRDSLLSTDSELAITKLKNMGYKIIIATGRHPKEIADKIIGNNNIEKYLIGANGSIIWDREANKSVLITNIPNDHFSEFLKDVKEFESMIVYVKAVRSNEISRYRKMEEFFNPSQEQQKIISKPTAVIGFEFKKNEKWENTINYWTEKYKGKLSISISSENFVTVNKTNISKWQSIRWVAKKLHMHDNKIITFGDSLNDREMIENSDLGISMGNANKKLIEISDHTIGDSEESGILRFVEEIEKDPNILLSKFKR